MKYLIAMCAACFCCMTAGAAESGKSALFLVTSGTKVTAGGNTLSLGYWGEELALPAKILTTAGISVSFASPDGTVMLDPNSVNPQWTTPDVVKLVKTTEERLSKTRILKLSEVNAKAYDAVLVIGGHGAMFDLNRNPLALNILKKAHAAGKIVAAECHGTGALAFAGLIKDVPVTGFPQAWEPAELKGSLPYSLEEELNKASGGKYQSGLKEGEPPKPLVIVSGRIITSRDPMSSKAMGEALVKALGK